MKHNCIAFLLLLTAPISALAQVSFTAPVRISLNAGAHAPVVHVGRAGIIFASWFERSADIYFAKSTNGGKSFSSPVRASRQVTTNIYTSMLQRAPEFVVDTKGTIHLVWTEGRLGSQSDVWYIRSTDQGTTWTQPTSIMDADDSQKYAQDFSAIACDSSDNLYVSYLDNRWLMRGAASDHYQMHMQRSTDGGKTWLDPVIANKLSVLSSGTCECCRQDIAVSPEGHVYIAFRTSQDLTNSLDDRSIFICRSWDKGVTWDNSIRCQTGTWNLTACPTKGPHISLNPHEDLFVSWNDARDDSAWLFSYFAMLPKGETEIFPNVSMSQRAQSGMWPAIAMTPLGYVAYAFMPSGGPVQFTYSSDGGNTWNRDRALPGRSGDDQSLPSIAFDAKGNVLVAWQDADSDAILFSEVSGMNARVPIAAPVSAIPITIAPAPLFTFKWHKPESLGIATNTWYTINLKGVTFGPLPTRDTQFVTAVPPEGTYNYTIVAHTAFDSAVTNGSFTVAALGVSETSSTATSVYPNPAKNGIIALQVRGLQGLVSVTVQNALGATVKTVDTFAENETVRVNVKDLPHGTYRAQVCTVTGNWSLPFVIR
jgi:hypothetical protein